MEQQDHIATLCAAGTVGIAAIGLALGTQRGDRNRNGCPSISGKRKWPGASSLKSDSTVQISNLSQRPVSQPLNLVTPVAENRFKSSRSSSLFQRQSKRDVRSMTTSESDEAGSRGSSMNRSDLLRPSTADTRLASERRDLSTNSSWLKRLSTVSSPRASSPSAPSSTLDSKPHSIISLEAQNRDQMPPNKLVKRSTSYKALANDQAKGIFLRRPATSHQRSATVNVWGTPKTPLSTPATPYLSSDSGSAWRPFFERRYPRKRHTTADLNESLELRTITPSSMQQPVLMLASQIDAELPNDTTERLSATQQDLRTMSTGRQRLKRSLSHVHRTARRRHFTDPTVKVTTEAVNGTISPTVQASTVSPNIATSSFHPNSISTSPSLDSSSPIAPTIHKFSLKKRQSNVQSDPTTLSSDNDTRVFTDDDSMDFQSDTAYDSLTTRATTSSHSGLRTPKLDTVFNHSQALSTREADATLASLVQKVTLQDSIVDRYADEANDDHFTIDLTEIDEENDTMDCYTDAGTAMTPVRSRSSLHDDCNRTPVQRRLRYFESPLGSSPSRIVPAALHTNIGVPEFVVRQPCIDEEYQDEIDWSPKSDTKDKNTGTLRQHTSAYTPPMLSSAGHFLESTEYSMAHSRTTDTSDASKRLSSIFDWSENQNVSGDAVGSVLARPRTVHGKQGQDGLRSRPSARKGVPQMHMRSQSMPNNRDLGAEQAPYLTSKFGTWGLGHKPVSEEWSDDFEFDDIDEDGSPDVSSGALIPGNKGNARGVKVPKSIMDRQASVHIQFGQVQEFMLLVEELKSLRSRGAALQLLETHSKQLWEDAESIIDLATINDGEDEGFIRPDSPTLLDVFGDEAQGVSRAGPDKTIHEEPVKSPIALRSVSSPATPPTGRPRGESLAQAKTFLQSIHQSRSGVDSSPLGFDESSQKKLAFDTQDLKDLVVRSAVITRALKEIVRKAEGLTASPQRTPPQSHDPPFSQIFKAPDSSPSPPFYNKPGLPKSHSANSYLIGKYASHNNSVTTSTPPTALIL